MSNVLANKGRKKNDAMGFLEVPLRILKESGIGGDI